MIVDSHCHLDRIDLTAFDGKLENVIATARSLGVSHMLSVCVTMENFPEVLAIAQRFPNVFASVGKHPVESEGLEPTVEDLVSACQQAKVIAIGETGLDYYHCTGDRTWQQERFRTHLCAAQIVQKPVIIHTRQAREDTIQILREEPFVPGVLHCFTESWEMAKAALDHGLYISFSGILTFKNAKELQEVAKKVPLDRILVETDAPYLTPAPYRGKPNHPGLTHYVTAFLAQLKGLDFAGVSAITTQNFENLFRVNLSSKQFSQA